ncbi:MAG: transglycosylase SLT domain-containing protein [Flavobacteriales bacterium]|nr:transglycosylase SLT domain-containing protein [Flavobacteriales bacterium]
MAVAANSDTLRPLPATHDLQCYTDVEAVANIERTLRASLQSLYAVSDFYLDTFIDAGFDQAALPTGDEVAQRLNALDIASPFELSYNQTVQAFVDLYATKRRGVTARSLGLSELFFPLIEEELDRNGLPLELKYLAVVESALNPTIKSRAGAKGLWQFMYSTGKMYGLQVTSYTDDRNDPYLSTRAACGYLSYLYRMYNNWELALAAYNCGPGNVNKAIRRSGGKTNYWEIYPYLPRETRGYVPAFIAVNYIFNHFSDYNVRPVKPKATFYSLDTVNITYALHLDKLSEIMGVDKELMRYINPRFTQGFVPVSNEPMTIHLPADAAARYVALEDHVYGLLRPINAGVGEGRPKLAQEKVVEEYSVRKGDVLSRIAVRNGCTVKELKEWNHLRSEHLRIGQRLIVYKPMPINEIVEAPPTLVSEDGVFRLYEIQQGDTLWDIARNNGISPEQLKNFNEGIDARNLKPGDKIIVGTEG